ncbi:MAG: 1-acyl-sn-glycerol-3-phosphate acyltransferase [Deltaproteobacteria bacterium HGW-Deltaproteobacteria-12]|jgi:1-acyl-sn-glycerol-3-phosphate acyltransferase|nr:MAG: 1-acyl-sn-glycerol-3-phosphate acyltransferase [Deltaproteobacteria bacterium HGW-Deltaproteobacteria-12]
MLMKKKLLHVFYQPYKWLIYLPLFVLSTVFFIILGIFILIFSGPDAANRIAGRGWARFNCFLTPVKVKVIGRENIVEKQSYVIVANHQSAFDIFVIWGFLGIDTRWVMKKELRDVPLFGLAGKLGGNIYIDRNDRKGAREKLKEAGKILANGVSLIMLPEGRRSRDGNLRDFKKGAFTISRELGMPLLPVSIVDTRHILPPGTLDLFPGRVTLVIHKAVSVERNSADNLDGLILNVRSMIQEGIDLYARRQV